MDGKGLMRIGEVADRTGLSVRTIRHYDEVGLVTPSARSQGSFRLYTDIDVKRLHVVKRMKTLGFALDQMLGLLAIIDRLAEPTRPAAHEYARLLIGLRAHRDRVQQRRDTLRTQLAVADAFIAALTGHLADLERHRAGAATQT
jgi:DNA-binding transcriptional MerR regulator